MDSLVKQVFIIIGTLMVSLIIFNLVLGDTGRNFMWNAVEPVMQEVWYRYTLNDGQVITDALTVEFNSLNDLSTP